MRKAALEISDGVTDVLGFVGIQMGEEEVKRGLDEVSIVVYDDVPLLLRKRVVRESQTPNELRGSEQGFLGMA